MTASGEMDREQGIPPDERRSGHPVSGEPRGQAREREHPERREHLERPGGCVRARVDDPGDALRAERESRPVDGGRVAPRKPGMLVGGIVGKLARRIPIRISTRRRDLPVLPVRPGIRREKERGPEREQLDRRRQHADRRKRRTRAAEQPQGREIEREGARETGEEDPDPAAAVTPAATRVGWRERCSLEPRGGDTASEKQERGRRRDERAPGGADASAQGSSGGGGSVVVGGVTGGTTGGGVADFGFGGATAVVVDGAGVSSGSDSSVSVSVSVDGAT